MRGKKEPRRFLCTQHFSFFLYVLFVVVVVVVIVIVVIVVGGGGGGGGCNGGGGIDTRLPLLSFAVFATVLFLLHFRVDGRRTRNVPGSKFCHILSRARTPFSPLSHSVKWHNSVVLRMLYGTNDIIIFPRTSSPPPGIRPSL